MLPATILIVDDTACIRTLLVEVLANAGYQVYEAADGRQGLAQFQAQPVDLVLTDIEMPTMNGLDLILELTRAFLEVKVIAMSGACSEILQRARLLGARQILAKPLDLPRLLQSVEYELQH